MLTETHQKVTGSHLKRDAYLYIRQSTIRQVFENTESTKRQYALRERAIAMGWPVEKVVVIDNDLGLSGAQAADREGFQRLVADVGLGRAGIVMGLEVSRLARNSADWHSLLEICAMTDTLILDEDGIYNPYHFNDRLLLGLKGTMSEAELHVLRARLRGGLLNKARRGELEIPLPVGFVYDPNRKVQLEPDQQVQAAFRLFFDTFKRTGSATATCKEFHKQKILFPRIIRSGPEKGEIVWGKILHSKALEILHNPRYAGVYSFGKMRQRKKPDGKYSYTIVPRDEWITLIPQAHSGYISFEEFEQNQRRLKESAQAYGSDRRKSPPREGPALLQGLVICGFCGNRMTVRYHQRKQQLDPAYVCQLDGIKNCERKCQYISGASIDNAISDLLLTTVSPMALEVALSVQEELRSRTNEADAIRKQQVERARYEADVARQRFMHVDSANRLVASSLEADWNEKLLLLENAQDDYEKQSKHDQLLLSEKQRNDILSLSSDFSKLWTDPKVSQQERKRLIRLIIEDVTLRKSTNVTLDVRFKGGATSTLKLPLPLSAGKLRKTHPEVIQEIDRLLDRCGHEEIARQLNKNGFKSGEGISFNKALIGALCQVYNLKGRRERQQARGLLTRSELAKLIDVPEWRIRQLLKKGYLKKHAATRSNRELYEPPTKKEIKLISKIPPAKIGRPKK